MLNYIMPITQGILCQFYITEVIKQGFYKVIKQRLYNEVINFSKITDYNNYNITDMLFTKTN